MKIHFSLPLSRILHEEYGFLVFTSNPTLQQMQEYIRVCRLLKRTDIPFTPYVSVLYERQLSSVTYLIIEGEFTRTSTGLSLGYRYDFYKARYIGSEFPKDIKVYCEHVGYKELLHVVSRFRFLEKKESKSMSGSENIYQAIH